MRPRIARAFLALMVSLVSLWMCAGPVLAAGGAHTLLYSFDGRAWAYPNALVQGPARTLIGTAFGGGAGGSGCSSLGCGAIFQWRGRRNAALLHGFSGPDGGSPATGLVLGPAGVLYGTTYYGGSAASAGTVFGLQGSSLAEVHVFSGGSDGEHPNALIVARDGNLYGTTQSSNFGDSYGTIYRLTPSGSLVTLKTYDGSDGITPSGIMQAGDGNFYGTVQQSGNTTQFGAAFMLTAGGTYVTLHTFVDADGGILESGLIQATDGNFYGVASEGGNPSVCPHNFAPGCGTIYRLTPSGTVNVMHAFSLTDGAGPYAALVQASDGYLYGTTTGGGTGKCPRLHFGCGTIFRISLSGQFSTLYDFQGRDGSNPQAAMINGSDGALYGTTNSGGGFGFGTIFRLKRP